MLVFSFIKVSLWKVFPFTNMDKITDAARFGKSKRRNVHKLQMSRNVHKSKYKYKCAKSWSFAFTFAFWDNGGQLGFVDNVFARKHSPPSERGVPRP